MAEDRGPTRKIKLSVTVTRDQGAKVQQAMRVLPGLRTESAVIRFCIDNALNDLPPYPDTVEIAGITYRREE